VPVESRRIRIVLWSIIALSLAIHVFFLIAGATFLKGWRWAHEPFHACVEFGGAVTAFIVAGMLVALDRRQQGTSFNVWIGGALIGMGVLDGLHAMVEVGQSFVWLHSTATLVGGGLFALVWLPAGWADRARGWWHWVVLASVLAFGLGSVLFPRLIPIMVVNGEFTFLAMAFNVGGGVLFFLASGQLIRIYLRHKNTDDLLFCLHCLLFGAAAIMFEQSDLWDAPWWGWHLLRSLAYGVAFYFVIRTELREQRAIKTLADDLGHFNERLEERVSEMTGELEHRAADLERSNIELQQFAYVASHDLQAPLRSISGFVQLLQRGYAEKLDGRAEEWIQRTVAATGQMQTLIQNLLTYSRVESRAQPFEKVDLREVVGEVCDSLESSIHDSGAEVACDALPTVLGDRSQLVQLMQNFIGNGLKYRGEDPPRVRVFAEPRDGEQVFCVQDNGIGIDPQHHQSVFDIFRRLHGSDAYPGTGIGLAICRRVVERHGGRIWVESPVNNGSTFCFTLSSRTGSSGE